MLFLSRHFQERIFPLLKECRSWITYHKLLLGNQGPFLRSMEKTESIFIHIPKAGGKSILKGIYGLDMHDGFGHASVRFYQSILGRSRYEKYFKFAFVRNPWDRAYSGYNFARQGGFGFWQDSKLEDELRDLSFESFVKIWLPKQNLDDWTLFRPQYEHVRDSDGSLAVDRICYFEDMKTEYEYLFNRFHFHKTNCYVLIQALMNYHSEYHEVTDHYGKPKHDWSSHGADTIRYFAMIWSPRFHADNSLMNTKKPIKYRGGWG